MGTVERRACANAWRSQSWTPARSRPTVITWARCAHHRGRPCGFPLPLRAAVPVEAGADVRQPARRASPASRQGCKPVRPVRKRAFEHDLPERRARRAARDPTVRRSSRSTSRSRPARNRSAARYGDRPKSSSPPWPSSMVVIPSVPASESSGSWKKRFGEAGGTLHVSRYRRRGGQRPAVPERDERRRQPQETGALRDQVALVGSRVLRERSPSTRRDAFAAGVGECSHAGGIQPAAEEDSERVFLARTTARGLVQPAPRSDAAAAAVSSAAGVPINGSPVPLAPWSCRLRDRSRWPPGSRSIPESSVSSGI